MHDLPQLLRQPVYPQVNPSDSREQTPQVPHLQPRLRQKQRPDQTQEETLEGRNRYQHQLRCRRSQLGQFTRGLPRQPGRPQVQTTEISACHQGYL